VSEQAIRWSSVDYETLESVLRRRSGLIFQPLRRSTVETAAARVMQRIGVAAPSAFVQLVDQNGAVFDDLMAEVTIGETYFFREQAHFSLLRKTIIPAFKERQSAGQRFRAWSAGCSTGEEPYSIALALREEGVAGTVVGTDVSRARLSAARRGEYRRWSFRGVPEPTVNRYFTRAGDSYTLEGAVRREVEFRYLNLASDSYPSMSAGVWGMDVVFCRNVLIYFDSDTIARVANALIASLSSNGWLLLGATDPPLQEHVRCEVVQTDAGLVYRPPNATSPRALRTRVVEPLPAATVVEQPPAKVPPARTPTPVVVPHPSPSASPVSVRDPHDAAVAAKSAEAAYLTRDYEGTAEIVAPRAAQGTATPADLVLYIRALANLGRLETAGRICAAALDEFRDVAELHYLHAVLLGQGGQFAESARAAKRAIYLDRTMIVAHLALGGALVNEGDSAAALRAFAAAERLLATLPADAIVPSTDGEPAGRLLEMTRMQASLVHREDAA
jgi:chemotaxis protein methyltransferase CheR